MEKWKLHLIQLRAYTVITALAGLGLFVVLVLSLNVLFDSPIRRLFNTETPRPKFSASGVIAPSQSETSTCNDELGDYGTNDNLRVYKNVAYGVEFGFPKNWNFIKDRNCMFGHYEVLSVRPEFSFELHGEYRLLGSGSQSTYVLPLRLEEKYRNEGVLSVDPQLVRGDVFNNEESLSALDFVKHYDTSGEEIVIREEKVGKLTFSKIEYVSGIGLHPDYYIAYGHNILRLSEYQAERVFNLVLNSLKFFGQD